jgi:hypothetical protein
VTDRHETTRNEATRDETPGEGATPFRPAFFRPWEWATLRQLVEYIAPRDRTSASAIEAGVPEWIDHRMQADADAQLPMRGGLAWVETESRARFGSGFVGSTDDQRRAVLADIAFPTRTRAEMTPGAAFFSHLRDYTAAAFRASSRAGIDGDRTARGSAPDWRDAPPALLAHPGVRLEDYP